MSDRNSIFVGCQTQLKQLNTCWVDVYRKRQGKVVFLVGEAGIGKTSLAQQFSRGVLKRYPNAQYAYAQCDQVAGDISAYAPFIQTLNSLTEQAAKRGDNWFVAYMREVGPDILSMVPAAGPLLTAAAKSVDFIWQRRKRELGIGEEPRSYFGQQAIFQQFSDSFCNLARKNNPLLLFIDDWHWADTSSTNLLFHLTHQLSDVPLLLLATYRPYDAKVRNHPIIRVHDAMRHSQLCTELSLDSLGQVEVASYLAQRFPNSKFGPAFSDWLLDITNGNALFITEYVNLLVNEQRLTPEGRLIGDLNQTAPPENVEAVIRSRISSLDREARDMLAYGSVEGEQFTILLLSRLLNIKPLSLISHLRAIEQTHQLIASLGQQTVYAQQTTVYRFVHTLIHRTLYHMLEAEERAEINRLLLELRSAIYAQADEATKARLASEIIGHAAAAQDYLAEARYALVAAEAAARNYAHAEVLRLCAVGLQALNKLTKASSEIQTLRIDLLLRRGWTEQFTGTPQRALETYQEAEALARAQLDDVNLVRVLLALAWVWRNSGHYDQAIGCYEESINLAEKMGDEINLAWAYRNLSAIYWERGNFGQALPGSQKALAIFEKLGNKNGINLSYHLMGIIYSHQGDDDRALECLRQTITLSEELGDKEVLAWDYNHVAIVSSRRGDYDGAKALFQKALALHEEIGNNRGLGWTYNFFGHAHKDHGDYEQALTLFQKALDIGRAEGYQQVEAIATHNIGAVHEAQGGYDQALEWYQRALAIREKLGNSKDIAETRERLAVIETKISERGI